MCVALGWHPCLLRAFRWGDQNHIINNINLQYFVTTSYSKMALGQKMWIWVRLFFLYQHINIQLCFYLFLSYFHYKWVEIEKVVKSTLAGEKKFLSDFYPNFQLLTQQSPLNSASWFSFKSIFSKLRQIKTLTAKIKIIYNLSSVLNIELKINLLGSQGCHI